MSTALDHRWSMSKESTFGVPVTTARFYPYIKGTKSDWDPRPRQSMGIQGGSGRRAVLGSRRFLPIGRGMLTTVVELESKGAGVILDAALGVSSINAITGGSQMIFHTGITGTLLPSATIQVVKPLNTGSETGAVETYAGCTASKITIEQPEGDIPTITVDWDARSYTTATAAASPAYPSTPTLFDHSQGAVGFGGSLTAPTSTLLATGLTAFADFRSWKLEIDQSIDMDRWIIGGRNQPLAGLPSYKFSGRLEANATTWPAGLAAGTKFAFQQTWTTPEVLGPGFAQLQVVVPQLGLTKGIPPASMGETVIIDGESDGISDGTNRDVYVVYRTADTVL